MIAITVRFDDIKNQKLLSKLAVMNYTTALDMSVEYLINGGKIKKLSGYEPTLINYDEDIETFLHQLGLLSKQHSMDGKHICAALTFTAYDENNELKEFYILCARPTMNDDVSDYFRDVCTDRNVSYLEKKIYEYTSL